MEWVASYIRAGAGSLRNHGQLLCEYYEHSFHLCDLLFDLPDGLCSLRKGGLNLSFLPQKLLVSWCLLQCCIDLGKHVCVARLDLLVLLEVCGCKGQLLCNHFAIFTRVNAVTTLIISCFALPCSYLLNELVNRSLVLNQLLKRNLCLFQVPVHLRNLPLIHLQLRYQLIIARLLFKLMFHQLHKL